jgi:hypothetical protein
LLDLIAQVVSSRGTTRLPAIVERVEEEYGPISSRQVARAISALVEFGQVVPVHDGPSWEWGYRQAPQARRRTA